MQFYDATNKRAICQEIDRLCDSDDTAYPRLDKTARVNDSLEELVGDIISKDGTWEWDDTNQTDLPVGTATLVEGQESYSFAAEYLKIKRLKIKDLNGNWIPLQQLDQEDLRYQGFAVEQYFGLNADGTPKKGFPLFYDILGDSFRLYPAPTSTLVTLTSGLKVEFVRTATFFTAVSTTVADTKEPGLPSPYHILLAYMSALPYCAIYKQERVPWIAGRIAELKKKLIDFYGQRNADRRPIMTTKSFEYR